MDQPDTEFGEFLATKGESAAFFADHPAWHDMPEESARQLMDHFKETTCLWIMSTRSIPIVFTFSAEGAAAMKWGPGMNGVEELAPLGDDEDIESMNAASSVWLIYFLVVCYALAYQFQQPIEPFLVDQLVGKADGAATYGRVKAAFGVTQCFGSLVVGLVLDRYGVRAGLLVNYLACALQYGLLSIASGDPDAIFNGKYGLHILYLSKVPGAAVAGFLCTQTAIIKVTPEGSQRLTALGRLTTAYTIGGTLGPYVGGLLGSAGDYFVGARCAVAMSLLAAVAVFALPKNLDSNATAPPCQNKEQESEGSWVQRVTQIARLVGLYLGVKICTGVANNVARSVQPTILKNNFHFDEKMMGATMSAQFGFGGFATAFLLAPLTKLLGGQPSAVVRNCIAIMGVTYLAQALLFWPQQRVLRSEAQGPLFLGLAMFRSIFQFLLGTSITVVTSEIVPKHMQGTLLGIEHSLFAAAGVVGPLAGTYIFANSGISGLGLTCAAVFGAVLVVWTLQGEGYVKDHENKKHE